MMRFLVSADIHLGSPIRSVALRNPNLGDRLKQTSRDTFAEIIDLAISEQVDALVLAGDIFDNGYPDLKSRAFLIAQLARASEAGVPTVLIRGNHDALLDHKAHGDLGPNIHLLHKGAPTVEIGSAAFHGLSFDAAHVAKSFLPDYPRPVPGKRNVGLMHTSLDGAQGHDPYAPCAERDLMAYGYDLWCLGHIHAPFERARLYRDAFEAADRSDLATEQATLLEELRSGARQAAVAQLGVLAARGALRRLAEERRSGMLRDVEEAFVTMTTPAWTGVDVWSQAEGEKLVGIQSDGSTVPIEQMSTGTMGQLYFALRLAGYRSFARDPGPLPMILDDIMETFDDTRARAALQLCAEIGTNGQAILFTHHAHLVELARDSIKGVTVVNMPD